MISTHRVNRQQTVDTYGHWVQGADDDDDDDDDGNDDADDKMISIVIHILFPSN